MLNANRRTFHSLSLRAKVVFAISFPLIIIVAIVLAVHAVVEVSSTRRSMVSNTEAIVQALTQDFEKVAALRDQTVAVDLTKKLEFFDAVEFLLVHDQNGDIVFGYRRPRIEFQILPGVDREVVEFVDDSLLLRRPFDKAARESGLDFATIRVSAGHVHELTRRAVMLTAFAGILSIFCGILLAFFFEGLISRPILELKRAAAAIIETGDFSVRAVKYSDDEVGKVADVFNDMLAQIQSTNALIESEVAARTAELRASERRFRAFLEFAPDAIVIIDKSGKIILSNDRIETIFGHTKDDLLGAPVENLLPDAFETECRSRGGDYLDRAAEEHNKAGEEQIGRRKDGTQFPVEITLAPLETDEGLLVAVSVRDISDRKNLEAQLVQAQKLESIGQLAAGIAHEINTPTQFIGDNTKFLQTAFADLGGLFAVFNEIVAAANGVPDPELIERAVKTAREVDLDYLCEEIPRAIDQSLEGILRVSNIVHAMKEFSHPGSREKTAIDINRALETTITVTRNEWRYVAEVRTDFDPDLPPVPCLPGELNQVFLNIIINGVHAIAEKQKDEPGALGSIAIRTLREDGCAVIRIGDSGCGIPEAIRHKIFDPFFTTKAVGKGSGQGLAISHSVVVDKHGGALSVESEVGKGSTFIIRLPLKTVSADFPAEIETDPDAADSERRKLPVAH
jgi:PAS domain S-box-containing protein